MDNRIHHIARIGWVTADPVETDNCQKLQLRLNNRELTDGANSFGLYGLASCPLIGAAAMILNVSGNNSNGVVVATNDGRYRPRAMASGEVQVYDNHGQKIYLSSQGGVLSIEITGNQQVNIRATTSISITAPTVNVIGDMVVTGRITSSGNMTAAGIDLDTHRHTNVQGGSGTSGGPIG